MKNIFIFIAAVFIPALLSIFLTIQIREYGNKLRENNNMKFVWTSPQTDFPLQGGVIKIDSIVNKVVYIRPVTMLFYNDTFVSWTKYKNKLIEKGFNPILAENIAKVEFNIIPPNKEYYRNMD